MKSLPLNARAETTTIRQPKQLFTFARTENGEYVYDKDSVKRQLNYYYLPDAAIENNNYNLIDGYSQFKKIPEEQNLGDFESFLSALIKYEKEQNCRINTDIITFRGLMTKILSIPYNMKDPVDLNIVAFDGQLFIKSDPEIELKRRQQELPKDPVQAQWRSKCEFAGYKFEQIATIPGTPWVQASRSLLTKRTRKPVNNYEQFISVVSTKIGSIRTLLAGEVDCVWDYSPEYFPEQNKHDQPLSHYVELKTSRILETPGNVVTFERKLFKTWAQCFLLGIKKVVYGFRDDNFNLKNVELYETEEIPLLFKNSTITDNNKKINAMNALKWYGAVLEWLKSEIPTSNTGAWRLSFDPGSRTFNLSEIIDSKKIRDDIISAEFKEWRESLKQSDNVN